MSHALKALRYRVASALQPDDVGVTVASATQGVRGDAAATRVALRPGRRWMFMGDSITNGSSATNSVYSYPVQALHMAGGLYAAMDSWEAGHPGYTSTSLLAWVPALLANNPGAVHLQIGTNDAGAATPVPLSTFQANITAIAALIKDKGIPMTIGTVPPRGGAEATTARRNAIAGYNMWLRLWAPAQGIEVADIYAALADTATGDLLAAYDSGDGVHPNNAGHTRMAQEVAAAMRRTMSTAPPSMVHAVTAVNLYPNPLMLTGTGNPTGTYAAATNTGTAATPTIITDTTGLLPAGKWAQIELNAAATSSFGRDYPLSAGWAVGDTLAVHAVVQIEDVTGAGAWVNAVNAATGGATVHLINTATGATFGSVAADRTAGRIVGTNLYQYGPTWRTSTIPTGITGIALRYKLDLPSGVHVRARFGVLGVFNLTALGITPDGTALLNLAP